MPYRIQLHADAVAHLRGLKTGLRNQTLDAIYEQLTFEPAIQTRNRKEMRENSLAMWELRCGDVRVYYNVDDSPELVVSVRAVGIKDRNKVYIAGEEYEI